MRLQDVSLRDVVESALETFRERAAREGVELVRSFDGEGPVRGDPEQLRRIAINLVGNAMDALAESRTGAPRIEVALGEDLAGTKVWMRVRDNGHGIDAEVAARLFDPFVTAKPGGTGLGLSITRKLAELHGGEVELEERSGSGTGFVVTLPKRTTGDAR